MSFQIRVEPKHEFSAEVHWWKPGMELPLSAETNPNGQIVLTLDEVLKLSKEQIEAIPRPFSWVQVLNLV